LTTHNLWVIKQYFSQWDFTFDASIVNVFDDMVRRSVPGYQSMIEMIGLMVKTYGQNNTNYYDLGASQTH
jgi:tRNA (cmo5U34)-methyltransferase